MRVPNTYTSINETGCCAVPNTADWDEKEVVFDNKLFIRKHTMSVFYIPLNMAKVMNQLQSIATQAKAEVPPQEVMTLSRDLSPWRAEHLYAVSHTVDGADNVTLSGTFLTKVFEGPFKSAGLWHTQLLDFAKKRHKSVRTTYFFYTTCPNCAKHYGKNFVIGLAQTAT
jgi:hypothetical protein